MSELLIDNSDVIFTIDKPIIIFPINSNINKNLSESHLSPESECNVKITNLMSNYIALRIRTTKKEYYAVNPTYCIISPNSNKNINFILYIKGNYKDIDFSNHKFRFEGILINENDINNEPKKIFENFIKNKIKVKGNIIKRKSEIYEDSNYVFVKNNLDNLEPKPLSKSTNLKSKNLKSLNLGKSLSKEDQLSSLKNEFNDLKNQFNILNQNYNKIKNTIENEKNKVLTKGKDQKITFELPQIEEISFDKNFVLILCLISFVFGFYLTK